MNPWSTDAAWQNFSSLCQEASSAQDAPEEIGKFHHLTAALYFGIAALEAFLNQQMRTHMAGQPEVKVFRRIRDGRFLKKLNEWPTEILRKPPPVSSATLAQLELFYWVRGDLTHPKTNDGDVYRRLETIDPPAVLSTVSEFCIRFLEARGEEFPYWYLGWNYLNPRPGTHEMLIIHNQQFLFSLQYLGFRVPAADALRAATWRQSAMTSYRGFCALRQALDNVDRCEPKDVRFVWRPTLCRRWWSEDHQRTCGNVTPEAIRLAVETDRRRGKGTA